jgi:hypothetical protein
MRFELTIDVPEDRDDPQRHLRKLRSWLKHSLRAWQVRCMSVVPQVDTPPMPYCQNSPRGLDRSDSQTP